MTFVLLQPQEAVVTDLLWRRVLPAVTQHWLQPRNLQPGDVSKSCCYSRSTEWPAVRGVPSVGGRKRGGRKPTDTSAMRAGMGHRNRGQRRTKERGIKGFYRGELERTGRHRIYELSSKAGVSGSRECHWWKDKNHCRTWWQGWTRTTDLLNTWTPVFAFVLVGWHLGLWDWQCGRDWWRIKLV